MSGFSLSKPVDDALQIIGQGARKLHAAAVSWMFEHEARGMQKRPVETRHDAQIAWNAPVYAAVERIPDDRMTDGAQVDANLVGPPGQDRDMRQRQGAPKVFGADDPRDRLAAPSGARRHFLAVHRVATDRRVDSASGLHLAPDERDVLFLDLAVVKLPGQLLVSHIVLGDHHDARRAAIETVDDARPLLAADAAQIVDMMQQGVDEGSARVPGGRMHDHASRLVDDDDIVVLVQDRERQLFRSRNRIDRLRHHNSDALSPLHRLIGLRRTSGDLDVALLDQALDPSARLIGQN